MTLSHGISHGLCRAVAAPRTGQGGVHLRPPVGDRCARREARLCVGGRAGLLAGEVFAPFGLFGAVIGPQPGARVKACSGLCLSQDEILCRTGQRSGTFPAEAASAGPCYGEYLANEISRIVIALRLRQAPGGRQDRMRAFRDALRFAAVVGSCPVGAARYRISGAAQNARLVMNRWTRERARAMTDRSASSGIQSAST